MSDDELKPVPDGYIQDSFFMDDGREIVKLDGAIYNDGIDDAVVLCKIENENGENILKALDDHEEDEVYGKYYELISLFEGEENE